MILSTVTKSCSGTYYYYYYTRWDIMTSNHHDDRTQSTPHSFVGWHRVIVGLDDVCFDFISSGFVVDVAYWQPSGLLFYSWREIGRQADEQDGSSFRRFVCYVGLPEESSSVSTLLHVEIRFRWWCMCLQRACISNGWQWMILQTVIVYYYYSISVTLI